MNFNNINIILLGHPEPLVFQVPQVFFDILHKRLSIGAKKKRLPNSVIGFSTKDSLPMGVFSKYTWQFTNILHVKRIFDTPEVSAYLPLSPLTMLSLRQPKINSINFNCIEFFILIDVQQRLH